MAAIGCDLLELDGSPGERRAAELLDRLAGRTSSAPSLDDVTEVPSWLRLPRPALQHLAIAAALLSMGTGLSTSIDGSWLGRIAEMAGEDLLDWAIGRGGGLSVHERASVMPEALEARGFSLLRAGLRPSLRVYLRWAPGDVACADPREVDVLIAAALEAPPLVRSASTGAAG